MSDFVARSTDREELPKVLREALEDIDAYLETMPAKTDDWSIGYEAITPFVKSLRLLREQFEGRGDVISELLTEIDAIGELVELKDGESISETIEAALSALQSENERLKETALLVDWLDSLGRFNVGLNPHDGTQLYALPAVGNGIPVILRLWHKDRGGENQSLRDAIIAARISSTGKEMGEQ